LGNNQQLAADALRVLHGARRLPPIEAVEALTPFLETIEASGNEIATAAVSKLVRSLEEHQSASDDLLATGYRDHVEPCQRIIPRMACL
jgi:hypothetical protein